MLCSVCSAILPCLTILEEPSESNDTKGCLPLDPHNVPPRSTHKQSGLSSTAAKQQSKMARRVVHSNKHDNRWMNATWMPHVSVSQTSHVVVVVRSALLGKDDDGLDAAVPAPQWDIDDWKVRVSVHGAAGVPLVPVPTFTSTSTMRPKGSMDALRPCVASFTHCCEWNEAIQIPLRWRDLPRDTYLNFQVLGVADCLLHEVSMRLFDEFGRLKSGLQKLDFTPLHDAEGVLQSRDDRYSSNQGHTASHAHPAASTAGQESKQDTPDEVWEATLILDRINRLQDQPPSATNKVVVGQIPAVPWLDKISTKHCDDILQNAITTADYADQRSPSCLVVELPNFAVPIMHEETFYALSSQGVSGNVSSLEFENNRAQSQQRDMMNDASSNHHHFSPLDMVPFLDYHDGNVFEDKYRALAHDLLRGMVDPALKPDRMQRDQLAAIIASPSHHPTREEKDLLWRFRFSLVENRRALTKFLLAVDWTVEGEVVQAAELLEQWRMRSPIEVTDALKLLGKQVAYQTNLVRAYAIDTLASAPDDELRLYLLQLVQALKFENQQDTNSSGNAAGNAIPAGANNTPATSLGTFLIDRASKNLQLANYLYWYLKVELQDAAYGARYREVFAELQQKLSQTPCNVMGANGPDAMDAAHRAARTHQHDARGDKVKSSLKSIVNSVSKLGVTLVGAEGNASSKATGRTGSHRTKLSMWDVLTNQDVFISGIMDAQLAGRDTRGKKDAKEANLIKLLEEGSFDPDSKREPFPLPSAPDLIVNGVQSSNAKMFKSALYPALLEFNVVSASTSTISNKQDVAAEQVASKSLPKRYKVIVKTGDDLRQDQLVIMMIQLMDGLLKRATLDLCLTPYSIIATSQTSGLVDFVNDSIPVAAILAKHNNSILQFFKTCAPQAGAKYDVRPDVMSAYVRSCAGYCVITYLLGVGDRHLENILITTTGRFFHIDFGFMFGRDPKPLPPPFRLTREMVEGMGGLDSVEYRQFCSLSCQAFNALRKSAGLVLNLLHLMSDAGIEDLSNNPTADPDGVIARVEERFQLDLTDEKAERFFLKLINDSLTALAPRVMDVFHSIAVARR